MTSSPASLPKSIHHERQSSSSYQITVNKGYTGDEEDESPPPMLPPRNYRPKPQENSPTVPSPQVPKKQRYPDYKHNGHTATAPDHQRSSSYSHDSRRSTGSSSGSSGSLTMTGYTNDYDQTPKPDYYADQLRAQARRQSQSLGLHPARGYQKSSKAPEIKTGVSVAISRPVDRPPQVQEAQAVIPAPLPSPSTLQNNPAIYRANNISRGLNLVGLPGEEQLRPGQENNALSPSPATEHRRSFSNSPQQQDQPGSRGSYNNPQQTSNEPGSHGSFNSPQTPGDSGSRNLYNSSPHGNQDLTNQRSSYSNNSNSPHMQNEPGNRGSYNNTQGPEPQLPSRVPYNNGTPQLAPGESQTRYYHHSPQTSQLSDPGSHHSSRGSYHSPQASQIRDPGSGRSDPGSHRSDPGSRGSYHSPQASIVSTTSGYHSPKTDSSSGASSRRVSDPTKEEIVHPHEYKEERSLPPTLGAPLPGSEENGDEATNSEDTR